MHIYFRHPGGNLRNRTGILAGVDFRGEGGYVVSPPSVHISGEQYQWQNESEDIALLPSWLFDLVLRDSSTDKVTPQNGLISESGRNNTLISIGGFLKARGIAQASLEKILLTVSNTSFDPPLAEQEVRQVVKSLSRYDHGQPWGEPEELPESKTTSEPLLPDDLPACLAPWLTDIATRMQIPIEFVAAPALISVATLVGRKMGIRPLQNDDWTVVPNLWGFLVAEPGAMKSPAIAAAMKPLEIIEKGELQKFEKACVTTQEEQRKRRSEIEGIRQALKVDLRSDFLDAMEEKQRRLDELEHLDSKHKEIPEKRYKTNDPTVEKLALILKDNPQGVLLLRDELSGWLDSLTRSGREGSKEFYLETWNGQGSFSVDRIGRGSVHVDALCLSVFGGIQPAKLESYIDRTSTAAGDDGFLERFQIVFYPERPKTFELIDRKPLAGAFDTAFECLSFLDNLTGNVSNGSYLRFSQEAQKVADQWRIELEMRIINENIAPIFRSHVSKYRSLLPSLALLFSILHGAHHHAIPLEVEEPFVRLAIRWCRILESHTLKVYDNSIHDHFFSARALAAKIKNFDICDGDRVREIGRKNWKGLNSSERIQDAMDCLTQKNWVRLQKVQTKGGPSEVIRINPSIPVGGKSGGKHV